jgi:alanine racemase
MAAVTTATLTISLPAIAANYRQLALRLGTGAQLAAAVKANAYGLGVAAVAPSLAAAGCSFFYVAHLQEAIELRKIFSALPPQVAPPNIAVLHGIAAADYAVAQQYNVLPVLGDLPAVQAWRQVAAQHNQCLPVLIHLDTGMNRLGLTVAEIDRLAADPALLAGLQVRYWLSHLACADAPDSPMNQQQHALFEAYTARLPAAPRSFANSSGIFLGTAYHYAQARSGCALYGINPTPAVPNPMQPVVQLTAPVLQLRPLAPNTSVGYGASWRSPRVGRLAVLPVGYADGFSRALSNCGTVFFGTYAAPVVGRVSMDLLTVDVTAVPEQLCAVGAMAELIGLHQPVDAVAAAAGTIGYEILTNLGARYHRGYKEL